MPAVLPGLPAAALPRQVAGFDEEVDVVVVGYGFAGAVAAISAHDAGARVLLIEKTPDPGGISICSGGGLRLSQDRAAALAYMTATNDGTTPDDVIAAFVEEMVALDDYVLELARVNGATVIRTERPGSYPFPGAEAMYFLQIDQIPGFDPARDYPHARALAKGPYMMRVLEDNVRARGIDARMETAARRLILGPDGAVQGLWLEGPVGTKAVRAAKGVILACGGFEHAPELQRQYWQLHPVTTAAFRGNTGDGLRMALDAGADLWHMWHFHGSYGFRKEGLPYAIRTKRLPDWVPELRAASAQMAWVLVDRHGRRFMNEFEPYLQDTGHRPLDRMDVAARRMDKVPCFMIVDDIGRQMYPLGHAVFNDRTVAPYDWSRDNLKEVDNGLLRRANTVAELAALVGCPTAELTATLQDWNTACADGRSDRLGRPAETMVPIATPPFYVGEIWPVVSNTQGGPVHDALQRVLNPFGEPIPRLYEAGEVGSIWGHLYVSGGNLTECFAGGRVAGREVAALSDWVR